MLYWIRAERVKNNVGYKRRPWNYSIIFYRILATLTPPKKPATMEAGESDRDVPSFPDLETLEMSPRHFAADEGKNSAKLFLLVVL